MADCYYTRKERRLVCDGQIIEDNPINHPDIVKKMIDEAKRTGVYDKVVQECLKNYPDSMLSQIGASINMPMDKRREILKKWRDNCIKSRLRFVTHVCEYKWVDVKYPCEKNHPTPHDIEHPPIKKPIPKPKPKPQPKPKPEPKPQREKGTASGLLSSNKVKAGLAAAVAAIIALFAGR